MSSDGVSSFVELLQFLFALSLAVSVALMALLVVLVVTGALLAVLGLSRRRRWLTVAGTLLAGVSVALFRYLSTT